MKAIFLAALSLAALSPAAADPLVFSPLDPAPVSGGGSTYVTLGGGVVSQQLPKFNVPYTVSGSSQSVYSTDATVTGGAGQLTIGSLINGSPIGSNFRIELSIGGFSGNTTKTGGQGVVDQQDVFSINGQAVRGCGGCDTTATVKFDYQEIGGVLRLKSDFATAPGWTMTPSVGLLATQSRLHYRSDSLFIFLPPFGVPAFVDEKLDTFRVGSELGLNFGYQATRELSFNAGLAVSLYAMTTNFKGNDCYSSNQFATLPCSGALISTNIATTDTRFGNRDRLNLSGTYDGTWGKFTLAGFSTWDSAMPGVTNPTTNNTPARISYDSRWGYGGAAMLTIPFAAPR